jgi:copper chaperone CopZ
MTTTAERTLGYESFVVRNVHCATCAETLRHTIASLPGVREVQVDPMVGWTYIGFEPDVVTADELIEAVEAGGYEIVWTWD